MSGRRLPVVMYHTIGDPDPGWLWAGLACPLALFQGHMERLNARGFRPATLDDVHDRQAAGTIDATRLAVLTFDDGYLDNWVHAYPLMKRAGWKGIVYVNPDFIEPGDTPRPTLEDVWSGKLAARDLQYRGFLNWAEVELLDRSGVLAIGSHSMSHTWFPVGPEMVDFHRPGSAAPWLAWNARPDRKPYYLNEDQSGFVPWGAAIHSHGRSLGVRRWFPDPDIDPALVAHVAAHGGAGFFGRPDWRRELEAVAQAADGGRGRFETDQEMRERFVDEIEGASRILADRLGHPVTHFCWPGGAYCDASWDVAAAAGFRTLTVKRTDLPRWDSDDPRIVRRISDLRQYSFRGSVHRAHDPNLLVDACDVELGRPGARMLMRLRKARDAWGKRDGR